MNQLFFITYRRLVEEGEIGDLALVDESAEDEESFFKIEEEGKEEEEDAKDIDRVTKPETARTQ